MEEHKDMFPHLNSAPITEALIDIRVEPPSNFELSALDEMINEVKTNFPIKKDRFSLSAQFELSALQGGGRNSPVSRELLGYWLYSSDEKEIVQIRKDGFTFNRLPPYTSWEDIFPKASKLWEKYAQSIGEGRVTRIAVRYINRLLFPTEGLLFEDYLTTPMPKPQILPNVISKFTSNIWTLDEANQIVISQTQLIEPDSNNLNTLPFILDIEVFKELGTSVSDETLLQQFGLLKEWENKAFFGSLKPKTIDMYI